MTSFLITLGIFVEDTELIGSVCADEFMAKSSFVGRPRCDYVDLCEVGERGGE
jgi:hypothetical protein